MADKVILRIEKIIGWIIACTAGYAVRQLSNKSLDTGNNVSPIALGVLSLIVVSALSLLVKLSVDVVIKIIKALRNKE